MTIKVEKEIEKILVHRTKMGKTESFLGSVTLQWLANRVKLASELPFFQGKLEINSTNIIRDYETIEKLKQRPLDWSRQAVLTQYLINQKYRKFPPIITVVAPFWSDDKSSKEWDNGRALKSATEFETFDEQEDFGFLMLSQSVDIFALDGQHRLMGIRGLIELINNGVIPQYTKNKKSIGKDINLQDLNKIYGIDKNYLSELLQEKVGIEFIPSVVKGETREEANLRVRSIFVHVNLMATPLTKGQLALLNEDNGFAIVARKIAVNHPLFREEETRSTRLDWDQINIGSKSTVLTTLQALQNMAECYLDPYFNWKPKKKGLIPLRPTQQKLEEGIAKFQELFDYLAKLPSYQKLQEGVGTIKMRHFNHEKIPGEGNILFRPVGQIALAKALGILVFKKGFSLAELFVKLCQFDAGGGFSQIDFPSSYWYGILYDPNNKRILISGRDLATKLIIYLLGGVSDKMEKAYLREAIAQRRTIEGKAIGFDGKLVKPKEVGLPEML